jgi:lysophospholipase L1-like esterase
MKNKILVLVFIISILGNSKLIYNHFVYGPRPEIEQNRLKHNSNRQEIFKINPIDSNSIVFLGSSLTEGFDLSLFFNNNNFRNRGIGGDRTDQVLKRLFEVTQGKPKKIFLEIGVNDLFQGISIDSIFFNIKNIVSIIQKSTPKTKIYIYSIFPTQELNEKILILNKYCNEGEIVYLNFYKILYLNKGLNPLYSTGDGVHLNENGYIKWKEFIYPSINQ